MIRDSNRLRDLATSYNIPVEDIILLTLNLAGVRSPHDYARMRCIIELGADSEDHFFTIVAGRRDDSPFFLTSDALFFNDQQVASVRNLEDDDCVLGYYRCNKTVLTLNSNSRSRCTGCAFCHTSLQDSSDPKMTEAKSLRAFASQLAEPSGDLMHLSKVTVCTGCFHSEADALRHLTLVRDVFCDFGFDGTMHFISSIVQCDAALDYIAAKLAPFQLTCSIECFTRRAEVLRPSKARISLDDFAAVLERARLRRIAVNFTYVAGIDDYPEMIEGFEKFAPLVTRFPLINGFQPHTPVMDRLLARGAEKIEFHLRARKDIESIFLPTQLRPQSWECYRSFWFYRFAEEPISGPRI